MVRAFGKLERVDFAVAHRPFPRSTRLFAHNRAQALKTGLIMDSCAGQADNVPDAMHRRAVPTRENKILLTSRAAVLKAQISPLSVASLASLRAREKRPFNPACSPPQCRYPTPDAVETSYEIIFFWACFLPKNLKLCQQPGEAGSEEQP